MVNIYCVIFSQFLLRANSPLFNPFVPLSTFSYGNYSICFLNMKVFTFPPAVLQYFIILQLSRPLLRPLKIRLKHFLLILRNIAENPAVSAIQSKLHTKTSFFTKNEVFAVL